MIESIRHGMEQATRIMFSAAVGLGSVGAVSAPDTQQSVAVLDPYSQCGGTEGLESYPAGKVVTVIQALTPHGVEYFNILTADDCVTSAPAVAAQETGSQAWPDNPTSAAALFGSTPDRWEKSADGGWHLKEAGVAIIVNPSGNLMEGYFDTKPGKNARAFASAGLAVPAQGVTIWNVAGTEDSARDLAGRMNIPVWDDRTQHPAQVIATQADAASLTIEARQAFPGAGL